MVIGTHCKFPLYGGQGGATEGPVHSITTDSTVLRCSRGSAKPSKVAHEAFHARC